MYLGSIGLHSEENLMSILKTQMIVTVEQTIDDATGHNQDEEEDACDYNGGLWWNEGGQTTKRSHATSHQTQPTPQVDLKPS